MGPGHGPCRSYNGGLQRTRSVYDSGRPGPHARRMHHEADDRYPTRVHRDDERRRRRIHHRAPARSRRHAVRRPERQGERGADRRRRPGADQRARPVPGRGLPDHRACRSSRRVGPVHVVLRRQIGTRAGKGGGRKPLCRQDPESHLRGVRGLPGHARERKGDRRRPHRHPRSPARVRLHPCDEGGQACVLREAAHAQRSRGTPRGARREGDAGRDANGQPRPLERGSPPDRRVDQGRRNRRRA